MNFFDLNGTNSDALHQIQRHSGFAPRIVAVLLAVSLGLIPSATASSVKPCDETSLRAAIEPGGAVTFDCDGTIVLTNTLVIEHDTTLDGSGHDVVISGNGQVRIFQVNSGVTFAAKALTIANGKHQGANGTNGVPGGDGFGAGVLNLLSLA